MWRNEDQEAFDKLKKLLTSSLILALPDFSKQFILFIDASDYGLGAILSQEQENGEVVIAYASKHLTDFERRYATIEKEAMAVIFGIKQFRHYLHYL